MSPELDAVVGRIRNVRRSAPDHRCLLVAVSGIDGCGKGYISARLVRALERGGQRVAGINIDGWLNLPAVRFNPSNPAEHFYLHAIRFDEMFDRLILPLRDTRAVKIIADFAEETATQYRQHLYEFSNIDIIVVEGIYLLKRALQPHYDLSFWIDCSFDTALERAISRAQEGLSREDTIAAYRTIFFPAQEIHFRRDDPQRAASTLIVNDAALHRPTIGAGY